MNLAQYILSAFGAINANAFSNLAYSFQRNYFVFILIGCLIATILIKLKTQIDMFPTEEENIL